MKTLNLDQKVPDFELYDDEENLFRLYEQNQPLLIVFYPGDDTPVCTAQLCDYRDGIEQFRDFDIDVVGINRDSIESHKKFKKKYQLPFRLLSDPEGKVAEIFGCKTLLGTVNRAVFLLDKEQNLIWYHKEVLSLFRRTKEELLNVIRELRKQGKL
ncbi:MAG: peroxiredoxin [Leptospiraceae bacterium]|nr:peroxiredoxin [Leptospiraceae bacterium]MDW7975508.1 peroxiredoxin [Leptospiraceae bacterium]